MKLMSKMVHVIWRKFLFCRKSFMEIAQIFDLQITLWKLRKFTITHFWQKFRESNVFTKEPIWRKKVRENFAVFHTHSVVEKREIIIGKKFRQINYLVISLVKTLHCFHEIFAKKVWENFCNFHTVMWDVSGYYGNSLSTLF